MAVSSFEDGVQKHQKVYSFLKRTLSQEHYEGVRVIEPCVIVTDGFNRTFQFAVLGSEILYITENPPRTAKDIKITVDLACVTSVELVSFCFKQVVHNFNMLRLLKVGIYPVINFDTCVCYSLARLSIMLPRAKVSLLCSGVLSLTQGRHFDTLTKETFSLFVC